MHAFQCGSPALKCDSFKKITVRPIFQSAFVFLTANASARLQKDASRLKRIENLSVTKKKKFIFFHCFRGARSLHDTESTASAPPTFFLQWNKNFNFQDELFPSGKISFASRTRIKQSADFQIACPISAPPSRQPIFQQPGNPPRRASALFHQFFQGSKL